MVDSVVMVKLKIYNSTKELYSIDRVFLIVGPHQNVLVPACG